MLNEGSKPWREMSWSNRVGLGLRTLAVYAILLFLVVGFIRMIYQINHPQLVP